MTVKTSYLQVILGNNPEALLAIREIPLFRDCSQELLELVYRYGRIFSLTHQQELTRENEFDQWVFFIISGQLEVTVGGERVDTITSSLVGERCLLGEPRRATLSAAEEGFTALGVDMALLDSLQDGNGSTQETAAVWVELLAIITGEIVHRVAHLTRNQIDIFNKFQFIRKSESITTIVGQLTENAFMDSRHVNMEIYKFLHRAHKTLLFQCLTEGEQAVDTRKFFARCVDGGAYTLINDLALAIHPVVSASAAGWKKEALPIIAHHFRVFSENILAALNDKFGENSPGTDSQPIGEAPWREHFRLSDTMELDIMGVCNWLKNSHNLSEREVIDALMVILSEASRYTALINGSIQEALRELGGSTTISSIEKATANPEGWPMEFLESKSPEEMIPFFRKHVLDVHLVNPFLEAQGIDDGSAAEGSSSLQTGLTEKKPMEGDSVNPSPVSSNEMIDNLFD